MQLAMKLALRFLHALYTVMQTSLKKLTHNKNYKKIRTLFADKIRVNKNINVFLNLAFVRQYVKFLPKTLKFTTKQKSDSH